MMKQNENEMNFSVPLEIIKASEIEPKEVKWLWYPYIPFGKVTLLQGDPGDGKPGSPDSEYGQHHVCERHFQKGVDFPAA